MNVVIAAWHLSQFNVGIGRYTRALVEAISRVDADHRYTVLTPRPVPLSFKNANVQCKVFKLPVFRRRTWEQSIPFLSAPCDVLHLPYDSCVAWKKSKLVTTIHDIKPLLFPQLRPKASAAGLIERWLVGDRIAKLDHVITVSESSKRDIAQYLGIPGERITVVYPGVDTDLFSRPEGHQKSGCPYIFSVAGADPTKNVEAVVKAYARLPKNIRHDIELVLAGDVKKQRVVQDLVDSAHLRDRIRFTGVIEDDELRRLYWGATLFVFPSLYEGFGFPVVEAMAAGCPVICSNTSSLPEAAGNAALFVDPHDADGLAHAMQRVLLSREAQTQMIGKGLIQAAMFVWDKSAEQTIDVYKRVVGQNAVTTNGDKFVNPSPPVC